MCWCRYNTIMKIIFLISSCTIIYWMRFHKVIKVTYDREQDTFRYQFLMLPCALLALVLNNDFTIMEVSSSPALQPMVAVHAS
jgi:ER lumen protein retaining receptor